MPNNKQQQKKKPSGHYRPKKTKKEWTIENKVVLITGANTGIGKVTALEFAKRGVRRLIFGCRSVEKGELAAQQIRDKINSPNLTIVVRQLELLSFESIRRFADEIKSTEKEINVLINNAGFLPPRNVQKSQDGYEIGLANNFLGPSLLTLLLLDLLKKSAPSRIVNVASSAPFIKIFGGDVSQLFTDPNFEKPTTSYFWPYSYFRSKLAVILFTEALHKRLQGSNVSIFSLHPGAIGSNIARNFPWPCPFLWPYLGSSCLSGSQTSLYCACEPGLEKLSSKYFENSTQCSRGFEQFGEKEVEHIWKMAHEMIGLQPAAKAKKSIAAK